MSQPGSFGDRKAAYAAWRERMKDGVKSNKLIDLTEETEPEPLDTWSMDDMFVASDDAEEDVLDELPA